MAEQGRTIVTPIWVMQTALIEALREEGVLSDAAFAKVIEKMRTAADAYERRGHPADAGDIRRDADELESGAHTRVWASGESG